MVDYSNIPYMFTYATSSTSVYNSPALIFTCLYEHLLEEFVDKKTALKLAEHPLVTAIMGNTYAVTPVHQANNYENIPKWIFHLNFRAVLEAMDTGEHAEILLKLPGKPLGAVTTTQIISQCYLPQKYVLPCLECATTSGTPEQATSKHNCVLKEIVQRSRTNYQGHTAVITNGIVTENLAEEFEFKHRKTKINDFVYISPVMTGARQVPAKVREVSEHFFSTIQESADCRAGAQQEKKRYSDFREYVCTKCGVYKTCENTFEDNSRRYCKGPYPEDQKECIQKIIQNARNPFTVPQLRYLLANTGTLPKRYNRFLVSATLSMYNKQLVFVIRRNTKPYASEDFLTTSDFKEARTFIQKYGYNFTGKNIAPITQERLAILYEAASRNYSPTYRGDWRSTSYPMLFIESNGNSFQINYSYQGRGTCEFGTTLSSLQDIYLNFECFTFLSKIYHNLRRH